jgi:hypothetical protein
MAEVKLSSKHLKNPERHLARLSSELGAESEIVKELRQNLEAGEPISQAILSMTRLEDCFITVPSEPMASIATSEVSASSTEAKLRSPKSELTTRRSVFLSVTPPVRAFAANDVSADDILDASMDATLEGRYDFFRKHYSMIRKHTRMLTQKQEYLINPTAFVEGKIKERDECPTIHHLSCPDDVSLDILQEFLKEKFPAAPPSTPNVDCH